MSSAAKKFDEVEEKAKRDVDMTIRRYRRTKAFCREADANYLAGRNECRATIMKANPEIDFCFITSATKTQPDPNFQAEGEDAIAPLVPFDDEYEVSIDTEESEKRRCMEKEDDEVEQPVGTEAGESGEADHGGEVSAAGNGGEAGAA